MDSRKYQVGDWVIYRRTKHSDSPGPRAKNVTSAPKGDGYSYTVDKFWIVDEVRSDGQLLLRTRLGKQHVIESDDPQMHRARWWERLLFRTRFRQVAAGR